ncbi:hypothetical protein GGI12_006383 [Dipsacomyces acuminosporus]|nr:hypothetical protein GGI12_006383 [Dipsacomyces acuminosporus]
MTILYLSSSIRKALLYEPEDLVGHSPLEILGDKYINDFKVHHGRQTEDNVILTNTLVTSKCSREVYQRSITFACGNVNFQIATTYPEAVLDKSKRRFSIHRFRCVLSEELNNTKSSTVKDLNTAYSLKSCYQACFVLGRVNADKDTSSRIVFATDSISKILDADSADLQGEPFLSLVSSDDTEKAREFLRKAVGHDELVLERLRLLVNPVEDCQMENPRCVSVEVMGLGSDDGAILLWQLERPYIDGRSGSGKYIPLEDIISSDPETTDFPDEWEKLEI